MSDRLILLARTGSHAYGTQREDSDDDYRGIFMVPLERLLELKEPTRSFVRHDPDVALHELRIFCKLAAACNPTVLETLWVEPLHVDDLGRRLVDNRDIFLSRRALQTYGGYARQQLRKAIDGTGGSRGSGHYRREKFRLHTMRLLEAGEHLLRTGQVKVSVDDPIALHERARRPIEEFVLEFGILDEKLLSAAACSPLPDEPDWGAIDRLLVSMREEG